MSSYNSRSTNSSNSLTMDKAPGRKPSVPGGSASTFSRVTTTTTPIRPQHVSLFQRPDSSVNSTASGNSSIQGNDPAVGATSAKKKRKKKGTKEERLRKREEKKFNELYSAKDTRVQLISASMLEQFRGLSTSDKPKSTNYSPATASFPNLPTPASAASVTSWSPWNDSSSNVAARQSLDMDFPSLSPGLGLSHFKPKIPVAIASSPPTVAPVKVKEEIIDEWNATATATPETSLVSTPNESGELSKLISKGRSKKPLVVSIAEFLTPPKKEEIKVEHEGETPTSKSKSGKALPKTPTGIKARDYQPRGNILDSSAPIITLRGKIRKPKAKKPSPLKKAILTARALRRVTIGAPFGSGQNLTLNFPAQPIASMKIKEENEDVSKSEPIVMDMMANIKIEKEEIEPQEDNSKEALFFRKLIEDTVKEAQNKLIPIPSDVLTKAKAQLHNRKFRSYCDMYVTKELHGHVIALLKFLHRLQDKLYHTDPIKFNTKRRYVIGLKNVRNYLALNKVRFIIMAPDIEEAKVEGGLDEKVEDLIQAAKENKIPYVFSGHRFILGRSIFIKTPVSAIGILDYQAGEDLVRQVMEEAEILREKYKTDFDQRVQELCKF